MSRPPATGTTPTATRRRCRSGRGARRVGCSSSKVPTPSSNRRADRRRPSHTAPAVVRRSTNSTLPIERRAPACSSPRRPRTRPVEPDPGERRAEGLDQHPAESGALGVRQEVDVEMRRVILDELARWRRRMVDHPHERRRPHSSSVPVRSAVLGIQRPQLGPPRPLARRPRTPACRGRRRRSRADGRCPSSTTHARSGSRARYGPSQTCPVNDGSSWRCVASPPAVGRAQAHVVQRRRVGRREPAHEHVANVASDADDVNDSSTSSVCSPRNGTGPGRCRRRSKSTGEAIA